MTGKTTKARSRKAEKNIPFDLDHTFSGKKKKRAKPEEKAVEPECLPANNTKRLWKRYALKQGAFVMIYRSSKMKLGKPVMVKLGPIKDISMRGLAVQYVDHKNILRDIDEIAIALSDGTVVLDKIKFRPIRDFEVGRMPRLGTIRTLCINFHNLLPAQKVHLERFIDEHACEMALD